MGRKPVVLPIQSELVDKHKNIVDTVAGGAINQELIEQMKWHQDELRGVEGEIEQAPKEKDEERMNECALTAVAAIMFPNIIPFLDCRASDGPVSQGFAITCNAHLYRHQARSYLYLPDVLLFYATNFRKLILVFVIDNPPFVTQNHHYKNPIYLYLA